MQPYQVQTVPFTGDYFKTKQGKVFKALKINPKYCVSLGEDGQQYNVPYGSIAETGIDSPGWVEAEVPRPGQVINIKPSSGMFRKPWFRQFDQFTMFVVTKSDPSTVHFVPLGGEGMPETTTGYRVGVASVEIVDTKGMFK